MWDKVAEFSEAALRTGTLTTALPSMRCPMASSGSQKGPNLDGPIVYEG